MGQACFQEEKLPWKLQICAVLRSWAWGSRIKRKRRPLTEARSPPLALGAGGRSHQSQETKRRNTGKQGGRVSPQPPPPCVRTRILCLGLRCLSHLSAQAHRAPWPRTPQPGVNPLTSQGSVMCVRKSDGRGSMKNGAPRGPHSPSKVWLCQAPWSPKRGPLKWMVWGSHGSTRAEKFRSKPISYHGPVLLSSRHWLPQTHLKLRQAPSLTKLLETSRAVTHFLPGTTCPSHSGTHFLLTASSIA